MQTRPPTEAGYIPQQGSQPSPGRKRRYSIIRRQVTIHGFRSFHEAYRFGLNTFCSEDFLVEETTV